ncbi:carbonic anhydrase [Sporodiniella umbellata]|nr:carbonic anhydrase [Sporodiniella umbellata]
MERSGDGLLSIYDTRKASESVCCTEELEDEPLSLASIRGGEGIVAGSQSGALYFWNWSTWSGPTAWLGHPSSVDALACLDQDTVCTGGSDGLLRLITVSPTQQLEGILGDHGQDLPVENIQVTFDQRFLASSGHDLQLRFWEIDSLYRSSKRSLTQKLSSAVKINKFDAKDEELDSLLKSNAEWSKAVTEADPNFFKNLSQLQEPKILWIGCADSRVPANQLIQLAPGEVFVHRNIANVVCHSDLNCLSVLQYAVDVLKVEHVIVCGHSNCGGVAAAMGNGQFGLIDNWLRNIKDVYRFNEKELEVIQEPKERLARLIECNATHSAENVARSTIVQNAWERGQKLTVHAWVYNLENGLVKKLNFTRKDSNTIDSIYCTKA